MIKMFKKMTWFEWVIKGIALIGLINLAMAVVGLGSTLVNDSFFNKNFWLVLLSVVTISSIGIGLWKKQTKLIISSGFPLIVSLLYLIL